MTKKYLFLLGNCPELAKAELEAVNPQDEDDPQKLIKLLGGTVKIAEVLPPDIKLSEVIKGDFGISDLTGKVNVLKLCKDIKKETGQRYVLPQKGEQQLSSVVVAKQRLTEIIIDEGVLARTVAVQDFEDWGKRDYGRPEVEAHIGMLPPKVARMMVNISLQGVVSSEKSNYTILDPFCGVGTILMEALTVGIGAVGSDIDPRQVERTKKNLEWLGEKVDVFVADARKVIVPPVDAIVTEPFLGPADPKFLEQLYLDCFAHWQKILKPNGKVVIATPFPIDKEKLMGYSLLAGPFVYARPRALIKRNICIFKYGTY